jgi:thiamine pyrophosphate-dependent acetolactate synthase large subunit-like protein
MGPMAQSQRDSTSEWVVPEERRPPLAFELEAKVDEALRTASAAESAVMAVGGAALDAADQARRAAELAERASAVVLASAESGRRPATVRPQPGEDGMRDFIARADRVSARLRRLQQPAVA